MEAKDRLQKMLHYDFKDKRILEEALTAAGQTPSRAGMNTRGHGNKALAQVGDALLRLVVVDDAVEAGANTGKPLISVRSRPNQADLSVAQCQHLCSAELSNDNLFKIEEKQKIGGCIRTSPCQKGQVSRVTGASTVEALIGAVWIDSERDLAQVHHAMHNLTIASRLTANPRHTY
jgi:ribonuclease-3